MAARTPVALTIAGSDSGGGAGIQADLKAFAALRRARHLRDHGDHRAEHAAASTPSTRCRRRSLLRAGRGRCVADIGVDAVKVGMLGDRETTLAVAAALDELPAGAPVVVDPVMVAESGARLLAPDAQDALVRGASCRARACSRRTCPRRGRCSARSRWPGADEAGRPSGWPERCSRSGPRAVVLTGGHRDSADRSARRRPRASRRRDRRARVTPTAPRTARAAPTRRRSPPRWRSARRSSRPRAARAPLAGDAVARGLRELGARRRAGRRDRPRRASREPDVRRGGRLS